MSFVWTSDVVEKARRLYLIDGYSAAETARLIGATRSAVIGKAHRMGWAEERPAGLARANLLRHNRADARRARSVRPPKARALLSGAAAESEPRLWSEREPGQCAWPVSGEGEHVMSCCAPSGSHAYCEAHRLRLYRRPPEDEAKALERIAAWVDRVEGRAARDDG